MKKKKINFLEIEDDDESSNYNFSSSGLKKKRASLLIAGVSITGVLAVGIAIGIGVFFAIRNQETTTITDGFLHDSEVLFHRLADIASTNLQGIRLLASSFCIAMMFNQTLSREEFHILVQDLNVIGVKSINWLPRVPKNEKLLYENDPEIQNIVPGFFFWQFNNSIKIPVGDRDEYYPVYYSEPEETNKLVLGFDFATNPVRNQSMILARDSDGDVSTAPTPLIGTGESGFIVFHAVYLTENMTSPTAACSPKSGDDRTRTLKGYVCTPLSTNQFMEAAAEFYGMGNSDSGYYYYLFDEITGQRIGMIPNISVVPNDYQFDTYAALEEVAAGKFFTYTAAKLAFANRTLIYVASVATAQIEQSRSSLSPILLCAILAFTGLVALSIAIHTHRTLQLQKLIELVTNAQQESEEAKQRAIEASSAKTFFMQNMSHEIRTPLNGIIGMVELLFQSNLSMEQLDFVKTIKSCSRVLLAFVSNILDIHKIEKGNFQLNPLPLNIVDLIQGIVSVAGVMKTAHQNVLLYMRDDTPTYVLLDGPRVTQIFLNLLNNAIKFTEKGNITVGVAVKRLKTSEKSRAKWEQKIPYLEWEAIEVEGRPPGTIKTNLKLKPQAESWKQSRKERKTRYQLEKHQQNPTTEESSNGPNSPKNSSRAISFKPRKWKVGDQVEFYCFVADSGIGMAPSDVARVFDRYYQVNNSTTSKTGCGLGLAICKQLCTMMNGTIWATSELGKGSVFHFTFRTTICEEFEEFHEEILESDTTQPSFPIGEEWGESTPTPRKIEMQRSSSYQTPEQRLVGLQLRTANLMRIGKEETEGRGATSSSTRSMMKSSSMPSSKLENHNGAINSSHGVLGKAPSNRSNEPLLGDFESSNHNFNINDTNNNPTSLNNHMEKFHCQESISQSPKGSKRGSKLINPNNNVNGEGVCNSNIVVMDPSELHRHASPDHVSGSLVPTSPSMDKLSEPLTIIPSPPLTGGNSAEVVPIKSNASSSSLSANANKLVLITEDNLVNQKVFKSVLKTIVPEQNIFIANNGEEAVQMCKERQFHFILMDISMPVMNGLDATKSIRSDANGLCSKSFICAMTGFALEEEKQKCYEAGMNTFLTKPLKPTELKNIFKSVQ